MRTSPVACPRCAATVAGGDGRLRDCPGCGLRFDAAAEPAPARSRPRRDLPALVPPRGVQVRGTGVAGELALRLPPDGRPWLIGATLVILAGMLGTAALLRQRGVSELLVLGAFVVAFVAWSLTRFPPTLPRQLTFGPAGLRFVRDGTPVVIPRAELQQLDLHTTHRGSGKARIPFYELTARTAGRDVLVLATPDQDLARYVEQRIEHALLIPDQPAPS